MSLSDQKIKEIEAFIPNVKFTSEDRDALRSIIETETDSAVQQQKIREFLMQMKAKNKTYQYQKELKKITALYDTHDFWESQPVPKSSDVVNLADYDRSIDEEKKVSDIREELLEIPAGFHRANVNIADDAEC